MIIDIEGVRKSFGDRTILDGLDLQVAAGETFVIIGRSGIGKSVTLRHIVGLLKPDLGRVLVFGHDVSTLTHSQIREHRRRIGYLFQDAALLNWMTIQDNVALPLREHGGSTKKEIRERTHEVLSMVELQDHGQKFPSEVSGGMRKRAGLARALVTQPEIILYDEPTSGLDPISSSIINVMVNTMKQRFQVAQVVVTHDMGSAYAIADRIGLLHDGRLHAVGTAEEIRNSEDPAVYQFIHGEIEGPLSRSQPGRDESSERGSKRPPAPSSQKPESSRT